MADLRFGSVPESASRAKLKSTSPGRLRGQSPDLDPDCVINNRVRGPTHDVRPTAPFGCLANLKERKNWPNWGQEERIGHYQRQDIQAMIKVQFVLLRPNCYKRTQLIFRKPFCPFAFCFCFCFFSTPFPELFEAANSKKIKDKDKEKGSGSRPLLARSGCRATLTRTLIPDQDPNPHLRIRVPVSLNTLQILWTLHINSDLF